MSPDSDDMEEGDVDSEGREGKGGREDGRKGGREKRVGLSNQRGRHPALKFYLFYLL